LTIPTTGNGSREEQNVYRKFSGRRDETCHIVTRQHYEVPMGQTHRQPMGQGVNFYTRCLQSTCSSRLSQHRKNVFH